jgi:hypothetical protein
MRAFRENTAEILEDPKPLAEVFDKPLPYRVPPFESQHWVEWKRSWCLDLSPKQARDMLKANLISIGTTTAKDFALEYPITEAFRTDEFVYKSWETLEKQYSARYLYKALNYTAIYTSWRDRLKLPDKLDIRELVFLMEWFNKATGKRVFKKFNSGHYKHPIPAGEWERVRSKVGNVYGTWRLKSCLSESESTRLNPKYVAECMACGHTMKNFSYSRIAHPCPACERAGRAEKRIADKQGKPLEITIWQMPNGVTVSSTRPDGAIAKALQTRVGEVVQWEYLKDRVIEKQEEPEAAQPKTETVEEVVEPATVHSAVDKRVLTLLDDMPGM